MPTKSGLLKAGDRIQAPGGAICVVTERLGNSSDYSVRIKREDGKNWLHGEAHNKQVALMLNVSWKLAHGWKLLPAEPDEKAAATFVEDTTTAGIRAIKANLASLNEIVAELAQRVAGASDSEFVELVAGILKGHSFDLGFEFRGERGPSSYDSLSCDDARVPFQPEPASTGRWQKVLRERRALDERNGTWLAGDDAFTHTELASGGEEVCKCGHPRKSHGRATVDTEMSCFSCGCWGFES